MDLDYSADERAFRDEVRAFIENDYPGPILARPSCTTVTAIIVAAIDFEESGRSTGETLDALLAPKFGTVAAS